MPAANQQVTDSAILVELGPKIARLQNSASGILRAAPAWYTDRLAGVFATLGGTGIVRVDDDGLYAPKGDGASATPTCMQYGDQTYVVKDRRHSKVKVDNKRLRELERKGLDLPSDYLSRHVTVAAAVHGWQVSKLLSSTGADRAFIEGATSDTAFDFRDPTEELIELIREYEDFFFEFGATTAGTKLVILINRNVAVRWAQNLQISESQIITGIPASGELARQGMTRMPRIQAFINEQSTLPIPVEVVVDAQVVKSANGDRRYVLEDDVYCMLVNEDDPASSFMSTPVYDYSGEIEGYDPADIVTVTGGDIPLAQVYSGPVFDPPGRFWAMEQSFGVTVYGSDPQSGFERALGYRFPAVLTS